MEPKTLEQRVEVLENQVAKLRRALANGSNLTDWRSTIGMFTGDEVMKKVFEEALKIREADRRKTRPRKPAKSRAKA